MGEGPYFTFINWLFTAAGTVARWLFVANHILALRLHRNHLFNSLTHFLFLSHTCPLYLFISPSCSFVSRFPVSPPPLLCLLFHPTGPSLPYLTAHWNSLSFPPPFFFALLLLLVRSLLFPVSSSLRIVSFSLPQLQPFNLFLSFHVPSLLWSPNFKLCDHWTVLEFSGDGTKLWQRPDFTQSHFSTALFLRSMACGPHGRVRKGTGEQERNMSAILTGQPPAWL